MKILKSIGLYFVYPFLTFILGILTHIGYLNYFYPNKYNVPVAESKFIENNAYENDNENNNTGLSSEVSNPNVHISPEDYSIDDNYELEEDSSGYYLMVQHGKIVVMEEDKETIYLTTDIYVDALSDSLKRELIMGKFIQNIDELYDVIISNPPIRAGKKIVFEILSGSFEHLNKGGELWIVIQKKQGAESSLKYLKTIISIWNPVKR